MNWINADNWPLQSGEELVAKAFNNNLLEDIITGRKNPEIKSLAFRDPNSFVAGGLHEYFHTWLEIATISGYEQAPQVLDWIKNKVNVKKFFKPFKGRFKNTEYHSDLPPRVVLDNNRICQNFVPFIDQSLLDRVQSGALTVWGKVGLVDPPHLVMPLTVEPTKPRLCHDERLLSHWIQDCPFNLDNLSHLPRSLQKDSLQTTLDDKSGYDHILLDEASRTYFGIQWKGWYFVCNTIPFGWKASAFIYHSTGLLASHYLRSIGIPCSLYIDDRHNGEIACPNLLLQPDYEASSSDDKHLTAAKISVFMAAYTLTCLGYTLGLSKCVLTPSKTIRYLGFISDTEQEAFYLPQDKQRKFLELAKAILANDHVSVNTLQRLAGKCISFRIAVQDSRLYTNQMNIAIAKGLKSSKPIHITGPLREEIEHWTDPAVVGKIGKWRPEQHQQVVLYSDASAFAWGGVFPEESLVCISDYWKEDSQPLHISVKETKALTNTLNAFKEKLQDNRVDAYVDNMTLVQAWTSQAARSEVFAHALKELAKTTVDLNILLSVRYIPTSENPADQPSRKLSPADSMLAPHLWAFLQNHPNFGGHLGHSIDLMALDSNTQADLEGRPLPHFTPHPTPSSSGVDFFAQDLSRVTDARLHNPYCFPPIILIGQVLKHMRSHNLSCTIVVPDVHPRRYWWPVLQKLSCAAIKLAQRGKKCAILTPSKNGFSDTFELPWDLWAFRTKTVDS